MLSGSPVFIFVGAAANFPVQKNKYCIMQSKAASIDQYLQELPEERRPAMQKLHKVIKANLSKGIKVEMNYGMIGYVVPHTKYPAGYHCNPELPLPFICIASQKNFLAVYHMGLYNNKKLREWFTSAYAALGIGKLDMGKCCIRFKNPGKIPFELIGELTAKMSADEWIAEYEKARAK